MARKKQPNRNELEELDSAYEQLTGRRISQKKHRAWPTVIMLCAALLLIAAGTFFAASQWGLPGSPSATADVTVAGTSLKGMTREEVQKYLADLSAQVYEKTPMVIQVLNTKVTLQPQDTGVFLDARQLVNDIYRSKTKGDFDLLPYLHLNTEVLRTAVLELGKQYNRESTTSTAIVTGAVPSLAPEDILYAQGAQNLTVTVGSPGYKLDTEALYQQVLDAYNKGQFLVEGSCSVEAPALPALDALYQQTYIAPTDAQMDRETFEILPESYGYDFNLELAKKQLAEASAGQTLTFPFRVLAPEVTAQALTASLFRDVLGSARTPYVTRQTNRNANLALACETLDGMILYPGDRFSYNDALGERTAERGYLPAPSYVNGLTVDTYGGGICQVSSTLYYSTLLADMQILERYNHGYISSYIDPGMDATVSWDGGDFRFANNTNYPIRIEAWVDDSHVNVQLVGTDEKDYYVEMHYKITESTDYDTVYRELPPDNEDGYKDGEEIVSPYKGYKVKAYKYKYDKETGELLSKELESNNVYKKRDRVICKIVTP